METSKLDMLLEKIKPLLVEAVAQTDERKRGRWTTSILGCGSRCVGSLRELRLPSGYTASSVGQLNASRTRSLTLPVCAARSYPARLLCLGRGWLKKPDSARGSPQTKIDREAEYSSAAPPVQDGCVVSSRFLT